MKKRTPWIFAHRPYHKKRRRGAIFRIRALAILSVVTFFAGGILYIISFSGVLTIQDISVHRIHEEKGRANPDVAAEIQRAVELFLNSKPVFVRNNLLFVKEIEIKDLVLGSFFDVSDIRVGKEYLDRSLEVVYDERVEVAIWCNVKLEFVESETSDGEDSIPHEGTISQSEPKIPVVYDECYYIDHMGVLFTEAPESRGSLILLIKDYGNYPQIRPGSRFLSEEDIRFILGIKNAFKEALREVGIKEFIYERGEITLITNRDVNIYLNREYLPVKNAAVIKELFEESIGKKTSISEYIDLRITNKVYFK